MSDFNPNAFRAFYINYPQTGLVPWGMNPVAFTAWQYQLKAGEIGRWLDERKAYPVKMNLDAVELVGRKIAQLAVNSPHGHHNFWAAMLDECRAAYREMAPAVKAAEAARVARIMEERAAADRSRFAARA